METTLTYTELQLDTSLIVPDEFEQIRQLIESYRAGGVESEAFRRFRLQNGIYGIRGETDVHMVRIKVPFGRLVARQLEGLADILETYSDGRGHLTTRQDVQLYWVPIQRMPDLLADLGQVGLTTREACGNVVRNVTADPLAGVSPDEFFDVRPHANAVARFLLRNPLSQNLPRKFKIAFSGSPADRAATAMHDIGALAAIEQEGDRRVRGFKIYVGGGLGSSPRSAALLEPFTPESKLLPTVEAIIRVYDRLGNRQNRAKARIKFLVEQMGADPFRKLVLKEREILPLLKPQPYPEFSEIAEQIGWSAPLPPEQRPSDPGHENGVDPQKYTRWLSGNVIHQKQAGFASVQIAVPGGDLYVDQFRGLAQIARRFSQGELFTTISQNLVLRWVAEADLHAVYLALREIGLNESGAHRLWNVTGCPGADTCNLAITTSHQLTMALSARLRDSMADLGFADDLKDVDIKISGCPNSCGQHHIAAIGFYGGARRVNGVQTPHYMMLLGGRVYNGQADFGKQVASIPAKHIPEAIQRVIGLYRDGRNPGESFHTWLERVGPLSLKERFEDLRNLPEPASAPALYQDWGQDFPFKLQTGEGECAI
ncbi:MAG: nitrite/sulfite reductase [Chloroflexota bacterium]